MTEQAASPAPDKLALAFEHSITWEEDIWRADPVDVPAVHVKARRKFNDLLAAITAGKGQATQSRILLFHGQSGAGKTHLLRALRTAAHRDGKAYFGYAQMTPDVGNYADYYLRRLVHSLEKPYSPDDAESPSGLQRLTQHLVNDANVLPKADLAELREAALEAPELARLILRLADDIVSSPKFRDLELDINIVRALLYLERKDPRIDQRVRQYLFARQLTPLAHEAVGALDPNTGEDRAFEIITALGTLIWTVDRAALVFSIDQVEDLRFFEDAEERFQRASRDLIQIANRVPTSIIIISCLEDFYGQVRGVLAQSYVDRIEKAGPVALLETRTPEEARLIIAKRLEHIAESEGGLAFSDPAQYFGPEFFEEFGGLSTRRLLEHAQSRLREKATPESEQEHEAATGANWTSTLASVLGGMFGSSEPTSQQPSYERSSVDYREAWERFQSASEAEIPSDENELMDVFAAALALAKDEWAGTIKLQVERLEIGDDVPSIDIRLSHKQGHTSDARIFLCNGKTQGGSLKRQLDKVLTYTAGKSCVMLRASDYPPNKKNQTAQAFRKFRDGGGRQFLIPIPEWERMMMVREFHAHHKNDPGFQAWFENAKLLSNIISIIQILRLDLLGRTLPRITKEAAPQQTELAPGRSGSPLQPSWTTLDGTEQGTDRSGPPPTTTSCRSPSSSTRQVPPVRASSAGREIGPRSKPVSLNLSVMKRHAAVLGGSGSG